MEIGTGLGEKDRKKLAKGLAKLLAESYVLYLKTHNFHWNVKGPHFSSLHLLFETQYTELALAVDLIAERIRALGEPAPGTYAEYMKLSSIQETPGVPKAMDMVRLLLEGNETVISTCRGQMEGAEAAGDDVTVDLLTQRMQVHEKSSWMLRTILEE